MCLCARDVCVKGKAGVFPVYFPCRPSAISLTDRVTNNQTISRLCNSAGRPFPRAKPTPEMGAEQSSLPDGHEDDERSVSSNDRQESSMSPCTSHSPMTQRRGERAHSPTLSHRNLSSRTLSGTASYDSRSLAGSDMTKAGLSRALVDDAKWVQAQEERVLKLPREQQRAEERRVTWERGRARTMAAREQPARVDRAIEAVRRHKAEQGREGREQSARIDRALTAREILHLEQREDEAAVARERRRHVAACREEVYYNNVSFAAQVPGHRPTRRVREGGGACLRWWCRKGACMRLRMPYPSPCLLRRARTSPSSWRTCTWSSARHVAWSGACTPAHAPHTPASHGIAPRRPFRPPTHSPASPPRLNATCCTGA
jgi:hypothetical protein